MTYPIKNISNRTKAFTLAELLIAVMVTGIIMSAVATLAYSLGSANKTVSLMGNNLSVLNHVTIQITELIKNSNQITSATQKKVQLWSDKNADGIIDVDEEYAIEARTVTNILYISGTEYSQCGNVRISRNGDFVYVLFDMDVENTTQTYQVAASLRGDDVHLLGG